MRPIANFTFHAILAAAIAALATTSAAAQHAAGHVQLELGGSDASMVASTGADGQAANSDKPRVAVLEVQSFSWGPRQSTSAKLQPGGGGGGAAQKDMVMKGSTIGENAPHGRWVPITEHPSLAGDLDGDGRADAVATHDIKSPRDSSLGSAGQRRQHSPMKVVKQYGAGRLDVGGGLHGCTVGAEYPDAVLKTAAARYELQEVIISGCAINRVSLNYGRVIVRSWDPEKKKAIVGDAR